MNKHDGWQNYLKTENLNGTFSLIELEQLEKAYKAGWEGARDTPGVGYSAVSAEAIYATYPRKVGRLAALKAIKNALEYNTSLELLAKTQAYAKATAMWRPAEKQFIPHPATWFNRGSYDDDPQEWIREAQPTNGRVSASNIRFSE